MTAIDELQEPIITADPDMDAVVATLVEGFAADPVIEWALPPATPDRHRYLDAFFRITTRFLLDHGGLVVATPSYDGVLVFSGTDTPPEEDNERMLKTLAAACGPCGERVHTLMALLDERHPQDLPPHVHGLYCAVRPESRGSGARAMLTVAFRELREGRGLGVYGEASSERSLKLWERLGSKRVGEVIALPDGGPSLYPIFHYVSEAHS